ncbi:hypothetical protein QCE63_29535 [Caballeronia sp. LZ065]|uniref:hypothetical protein n=1 Tax=Caballeronia sp. LZ065 TaxID=3038571 RepID=UPI0028591923|nr:hypothetical protein [Caballeronia sp. LZ065]MDR5783560.1 hypothetical protein [Caballeronia sp. LZ065]
MQHIAAYLLEARGLSFNTAGKLEDDVAEVILRWLSDKGVSDPARNEGSFNSLTANGQGKFNRSHTVADRGDLEEIRLDEFSKAGQVFTTTLSVTRSPADVSVHVTLSVTNTVSMIAPVPIDPRCPAVVRQLLALDVAWTMNGNRIPVGKSTSLIGEDGATTLLDHLRSSERRMPIVVVSKNDGEILWPWFDQELAYDLAGLAHVVTIDDEASWMLTEEMGKENSCYLGAVRLYWPIVTGGSAAAQFSGSVWTASALLSSDHDGKGALRFRTTLRRKVMSVAALTVVAPIEIRQIKSDAARSRLTELEERATANSEELEIAKMYLVDNEQLKADLAQAKIDIAVLSSRAEAAESALEQIKGAGPDAHPAVADGPTEPKSGDIRYYKKAHSKPAYDVLIEVSGCGHTSWQSASKAEKAKKGVEKLVGRGDWKNIQHCGACTGGGMWKVRW